MSEDLQYPDHFVERLHAIWGAGFLSPGGPQEVKEIVRGLDLTGKALLDIGCGTGGPSIVLARDLGAARALGHLDFTMATAPETEATMIAAGFERTATRDRNAWYADLARYELEQVEGALRDQLVEAVGADIYGHWLLVRRALANAVAVGALRPTHLRGTKPAA